VRCRSLIAVVVFFVASVMPASAPAAQAGIRNLRVWNAPDHSRLVFDLTGPVQYKFQVLANPDRVAVDLENVELQGPLPAPPDTGPYLKGIRTGQFTPTVLRIVLDLKRQAAPRIDVLAPNQLYGHRLVIDLYRPGTVSDTPAPPASAAPPGTRPRTTQYVIAIDAGHGGEDPGAVGRRGTREKDVALQVARELKSFIDRDPLMRGVMTRNSDYYISLRGRIQLARRHQAHLFVSIHADALPKGQARGSSVYALSQRGASSEAARWLADKENAADLIGGVSIRDQDDLLAHVLLDLSMTQTINDSLELGNDVLHELGRVGALHRRQVEQAGFVVLKSPDIPSILVETAFITNRDEERMLRDARHRRRVAEAIYHGIKRYAARRPNPQAASPPADGVRTAGPAGR